MGLLRLITEFFESLFKSSSPEVKKRNEIKKVESDLKLLNPVLYKSGYVQPNFAELLRILFENTKPISDLLTSTTHSTDQKRNTLFKRELVITGFSPENRQKLDNLSYEKRLQHVMDSPHGPETAFATQHTNLENLIHNLNSAELIKIDHVIALLDQLNDICSYNYVNAIKQFDQNFDSFSPDYQPHYIPVIPDKLETVFLDLYFMTTNFTITTSLASAVLAVATIRNGRNLSEQESSQIMGNLKKINSVLKKNLTSENLKKFAIVASHTTDVQLKVATYKADFRQSFATYLEERFKADESRIKSELKDMNIANSLKELFGERPLEELNGYNDDINKKLKENGTSTFIYILPLQIIKTFVKSFLTDKILALLNAIVVEGFFNSSGYKTEFSQAVFTCSEIESRMNAFEESFTKGERNDKNLINGYIADSNKNHEFLKELTKMVDTINVEAKMMIQEEATNLFTLALKIQELITDVKKSTPDIISNIKVLAGSARNKDSFEMLDRDFPVWKNFLTVMKNYVIIGDLEKQNGGKKI